MPDVTGRSRVLVIGAGPAGCAAGLALLARGVDVCVVDRARFPRDKICGDALSNRACALLASLGIDAARLVDGQAAVHGGVVRFPDGTRVARRYDEPGRIVPRRRLDAALHDTLAAAGARLFDEVAVQSLERSAGGTFVASGPRLRWEAETVIAADGPGSVAWHASGRAYPRGRALGFPTTVYLEGVRPGDEPDSAVHWFETDLP
jgi:2-polyprenyl-6-methoxyphenol hydroxylase-like FAD-dependent oxidoreductase